MRAPTSAVPSHASPPIALAAARSSTRSAAALVQRTFWPAEPALRDLRWAATTLAFMTVLTAVGLAAGPSAVYSRPFAVYAIATIAFVGVGFGPAGSAVARWRPLGPSLGASVVVVAIAGIGRVSAADLVLSGLLPLVGLALSFAAATRGFRFAALVATAATVAALSYHLALERGSLADRPATAFLAWSIVSLCSSTGIALVIRRLSAERRRADTLAEERRDRIADLVALQRIVGRFDRTEDLDATLQAVCTDLNALFGFSHASIYRRREDGWLTMAGQIDYEDPHVEVAPDGGVIGRASRLARTQYVPDVSVDPDYEAADPRVTGEVAVPILFGGAVLGVLNVEGTDARPVTGRDVTTLEMIGVALAPTIHAARLDDERRSRLATMDRVLRVSRQIVADLDREQVVRSILGTTRELLAADSVTLIVRASDGRFIIVAGDGPSAARQGKEIAPDGPSARAIRSGSHVVEDGWRPPSGVAEPDDARHFTVLAVPIVGDDGIAGALSVLRADASRTFGADDIATAELLAAQAGIALRNAELHARVAEAAVRDPLTGLLNRRYFDEAFAAAFAAAHRNAAQLSVIVFDLDHFSAVNNVHGHQVGDVVLRRVARMLRQHAREADIVARYGGEEFVVIAPDTSLDEAIAIAERIRSAIHEGSAEAIDGSIIRISVSAGVAALLGEERDAAELFRAADSALLAAKRAGRDRVVSF